MRVETGEGSGSRHGRARGYAGRRWPTRGSADTGVGERKARTRAPLCRSVRTWAADYAPDASDARSVGRPDRRVPSSVDCEPRSGASRPRSPPTCPRTATMEAASAGSWRSDGGGEPRSGASFPRLPDDQAIVPLLGARPGRPRPSVTRAAGSHPLHGGTHSRGRRSHTQRGRSHFAAGESQGWPGRSLTPRGGSPHSDRR